MQKLSLELGELSFTMILDECNIKPTPTSTLFIDNIEPFFYVHKESLDG